MLSMTAAAYALSRKYDRELVFEPSHYGILHGAPSKYADTFFKNIKRLEGTLEGFVDVGEKTFHYTPIELPDADVRLCGYFQSYKYLQGYEQEIRNLFGHIPKDISERLNQKYPGAHRKVSVHVRRGNYVNLSHYHYNLSINYYRNAMSYFKDAEFLVFSDDPDWCREHFVGGNIQIVEEDEIDSLYLMAMCKHNIIANSTFSFWGAYLNDNPNKIVVYPNKWFGPGYAGHRTHDIFPDEWTCLEEDHPEMTVNIFDQAFAHSSKENGRYSMVHGKTPTKVAYVARQAKHDGITLFTDEFLTNPVAQFVDSPLKLGWLLETREVFPDRYNNFENYKDKFNYILTHDSQLLEKYPEKTIKTIFGGSWINTKNYGMHPKSKAVSMIFSPKMHLTGHKFRFDVASNVPGIDLYGAGAGRPIERKEEALLDYAFTVAIENSKTDNYFTEKLVDACIVGTVPIYWGCPNIGEYFDTRGFIIVNTVEEVKEAVASITPELYNSKLRYITANLERAKEYAVTEDWMFKNIFRQIK